MLNSNEGFSLLLLMEIMQTEEFGKIHDVVPYLFRIVDKILTFHSMLNNVCGRL